MTTFRCRLVFASALFCCACERNLPSADTDFGRILRMSSNPEASRALEAYANTFHDRGALITALSGSGFSYAGQSAGCVHYSWRGNTGFLHFDRGARVNICGSHVSAVVGSEAP